MVFYSTLSYVVVGLLITLIRSYDGVRFGHGGLPFDPWKLLKGGMIFALIPFLLTRFYVVNVPSDSLAYSSEWDGKILTSGTYLGWHLKPVKYIQPKALRLFQLECSLTSNDIKIKWNFEAAARIEPSGAAALWKTHPKAPSDGVKLNSFIAQQALIPPLTEAFDQALARQVTMSLSVREYLSGGGLFASIDEVGESIARDVRIPSISWLKVESIVFKRVDYEMSSRAENSVTEEEDVQLTVSLTYADTVAYADSVEGIPKVKAEPSTTIVR